MARHTLFSMSKMPAKKKSCFQITSVIQAQASANNATDDTESLDDPDESRTEDVSSEIFDVSRTDYEPEVCGRSSSEETLNNVSESEGQLPATAPLNGGLGQRSLGPQGVQAPSTQTVVTPQITNSSSIATISSCSSRFRVIKLDHGTGEPFKRGRWTCTEYYEKDPEGSMMTRTVDSIRHANVTEPIVDRDSGIGATIGSVMTPVANDLNSGGSSFTGQQHLLEAHNFNVVAGSGSPESFSNTPVPTSAQQVPTSSHLAAPHSLHPDAGHAGAQLLKSPSIPPPQVQPLLYPTQPVAHHLPNQPALIPGAQPDYIQCTMSISQTHPGASLSVGHPINQGSSPIPTLSAGGLQVLGSMEIPGGVSLVSQSASTVQNLVQHPALGLLGSVTSVASVQQQPMAQYQAPGVLLGLSATPQNAQSMPVIPVTLTGGLPAASGLTAVTASATVPNLNTSTHSQPSQVSRNGTADSMGNTVFSQVDESQRMPDVSALVHSKDAVKPFITEGLQLASPAVNTLFGIPIPIDGEEDSASGASVVAIDNKIEQAMDLVKSHLMYAVREEVEVLKEQIKELYERNSVLERENAVLKSLANNDQLSQLTVQSNSNPSSAPVPPQTQNPAPQTQPQAQPYPALDGNKSVDAPPQQPQPNVTSA
ncbi:hypothetical protein DNTS_029794 [Danionella cerebrum]|uniref:TSC22 domain family member 2 n=1 Tax=Danionella cerebrum TaxID=2873325 RepID=A0A553ML93_9TELE|nr:hypothetical protein DNTS_029794 [Danionella translucida]